ncbi:MAG: GAF domain-containing sensor histidine kinase [Anaerolineales bacterium]
MAIERQATDTLVISLANQQRVLVHNVARSVLGLQTGSRRGEYYLDLIELDQAAGQFDRLQSAMLNGGTITYSGQNRIVEVQAISAPDVREQLDVIESLWQPMRASAEILLTGAAGAEQSRAITEIVFKTPLILTRIDTLTQMLEANAARSLALLKSIQIVFFLSALGLLIGGYTLVKRTIILPLQTLDAATGRIASGDLSGALSLGQHDEIGALARSFETMRQEVAAARTASKVWTTQLETRVQQRTQELAALLEISADISSNLDVDRVLGSVVNKGRELLGGEVAVLCLLDGPTRDLNVASFSGTSEAIVNTRIQVNQGLAADVIDRGQTVTCDACGVCSILAPAYRQELIAAPLRAGNRIIGAICVADPEPGQLGDDAARLLTLLLYGRAETAATLAERERIAADMHDGLAQTLGYLNLQVDQAMNSVEMGDQVVVKEHLGLMQPAIQTAYSTVRQALVGLSDNGLGHRGFKAQLEECLADFRQKCDADVKHRLDESCLSDIPENAKPQLLRIVQESLTNIHRHANAAQVEVALRKESDSIVLTVVDDGNGFDPTTNSDGDQPHLGLKIMRGRAERVGGSLAIQSQPGSGTAIIASVPLR